MRTMERTYGMALVLLGLGTFTLSTLVDGGFVKGLLQGATIALMVFGAAFLGRAVFRPDSQDLWRPSDDRRADRG